MKLWMIGNEPSGYEKWGNQGNYTAEDYAQDFIRYATALKAADPSILLMAMTAPVFDHRARKGFGRQCLDEYLLSAVAAEEKKTGMRLLEIVSFHRYPLHQVMDEQTLFTDAKGWNSLVAGLRADIEMAFGEQRPIAITEINGVAVYSAPDDFGEEVMADALWWADSYGALASSGVDYLFFFAAQGLDPPLALLNKSEEPAPTYQIYTQTALLKGGMATQSYWSDSLSIYVAHDAETKLTSIMFVNKSRQALSGVTVQLAGRAQGKQPGAFDLEPLSVTVVSLDGKEETQMASYSLERARQKAGIKQTTIPAALRVEEASRSKH